jgi:glutamate racemase
MIKLGIFDSGIGGLTVYREIRRVLPSADIRYFGDTARVPYGTKSAQTVTHFSLQIAWYLEGRGADAIVVACNTASAYALDVLRDAISVPVFGVVDPGARAISELDQEIKVVATPCPLFVPLVEEGWLLDPITQEVAIKYLKPHMEAGVDTLVLGCTHYPLLKDVISMVMGGKTVLIDSAEETAKEVGASMERSVLSGDAAPGAELFEVTDSPSRFAEVGRLFLDHDLENIVHVTIAEGGE